MFSVKIQAPGSAARLGDGAILDEAAGAAPAARYVQEALASPASALDPGTRAFMDPRLGHDFNKVRIHAGETAAESARGLGARAYTVGGDIVFGGGQYSPGTQAGRMVLAHELTHVVQQNAGPVEGRPVSGVKLSDPRIVSNARPTRWQGA